jgi:glycosyltransferase involved in cell wall biosynthesis
MRLLLANEQRAVVGGMETYFRWLARELCSRGHDVVCLTRFSSLTEDSWIPEQATAIVASSRSEIVAGAKGSAVALMNPLGDPALEEALLGAVPTVLFAHTFFGTCVSGSKMHAFPVRKPCERRRGLACLCLYGPRRCGGTNPLTALRLYQQELNRSRLLSRFRKVVVASRFMAQEFLKHGLGPESVQYIPLPVERPNTRPAVEYRRRVLFLGRMTEVKGVDLLVQAVGRLAGRGDPLTLELAGDGPVRSRAEALATRLGVPAQFRGWVDETRRTSLFREGGALALPSTWPEPFGLVGLEASAQGLPTVAYDVGGVREWLVPGVTGEIAPADPPSVEGLASALTRVLEPARWAKLSTAAYAQSARFGPEAHLQALEECLKAAA